ncbi:MAG: hypothetical protein WBG37_13975 [Desulfobacterales bacterium]
MRIPIIPPDNQVHQINPAKEPKRYRGDAEEEEQEEQPLPGDSKSDESKPEKKPKPPPRRPPEDDKGTEIDVTV